MYLWIQRAKKVVSDSPGLVDFAFGLVNSVLNLPNVQVMFFEEFKLKKNCEINSACQKAFGASWNDIWASKCYNQLQKYLRHCTVFWHKWPVHDLVLVIPPPPLIKVASNTRPYSKLRGTTLNGREEGGQYYISQPWDHEQFAAPKIVFSWVCLNIFATGCNDKYFYVQIC